jgi:hypothetical protein
MLSLISTSGTFQIARPSRRAARGLGVNKAQEWFSFSKNVAWKVVKPKVKNSIATALSFICILVGCAQVE